MKSSILEYNVRNLDMNRINAKCSLEIFNREQHSKVLKEALRSTESHNKTHLA